MPSASAGWSGAPEPATHAWAPDVEVRDDARLLVGGSPVRVLRLGDAGARVLRRWRDEGIEVRGAAEAGLRDRLVEAGIVHRVGIARPGAPVAAVTAVVPVRDREPDRLSRCLDALAASGVTSVVVVDDGSVVPVPPELGAERVRSRRDQRPVAVEVARLDRSVGPGAARTVGAARAVTDLVAFVDSDVDVSPGWLATLLPLFDDDRVALAAPRVVADGGAGLLGRHEAVASPLDLGVRRGGVGPGRRPAYVPAAALVVRRRALDDVGGFDPALLLGEDVDLVWRLVGAGWRCRYEPAAVVRHDVRGGWSAALGQRFAYGTSAAALDERHPGAVPPVVCSPWSLATVGLAASGHPVAAAGLAVGTGVRLARRLDLGPSGPAVAARLVARGHLGAARQLARWLVRPAWPVTLALIVVGPGVRLRRRLVGVVVASVVGESTARRRAASTPYRPGPVGGAAAWMVDEAAYGAGVWWGCLCRRRWRPLVPDLGPGRPDRPDRPDRDG